MIKNYYKKIISCVFIMLTIFMVSTFVFASNDNIVTFEYNGFEFVIDKFNRILDCTYTRSNVTKRFVIKDQILDFSNFIFTYKHVAPENHSYDDLWCFGLMFSNSFSWHTCSGYNSLGPSSDGVYIDIQYNVNNSTENFYSLTTQDEMIGETISSLFRGDQHGAYWFLWKDGEYEPYRGVIVAASYDINTPTGENLFVNGKSIIYDINYSEDNKTATLSAEIKNGAVGDKLYYSTLGYSLTGKLMNPIELNQSQATAITLNKNTIIHLQALDFER